MSDGTTGAGDPAVGTGHERGTSGTVETTRRRVLQGLGVAGAGLGATGVATAASSSAPAVALDVWPAGKRSDSRSLSVEQGETFRLQIAATNRSTRAYGLFVAHQEIFPCGIAGFIPPTWYDVTSHTDDGSAWQSSNAKPGWKWSSVDAGERVSPSATYRVPDDQETGSHRVQVEAKLGSCSSGATPAYASDSVEIEVLPATSNAAPTADAGTDSTVAEETSVTLDGTGSSDPDGDTLGYDWTQTGGPVVSLTGATTATPSFTAPAVSARTDLTFELTVDDGTATDSDTVRITVTPASSEGYTDPLLDRYDSSGDGRISLTELGQASADFANGDISLTQLGKVSRAYANS